MAVRVRIISMAENNTPDIASQIYAAIANGLNNDQKWQISPQNFIRYDNIDGVQSPEKPVLSDGDYPQAILRGPVSGETGLQTDSETFATYSDAGADWLEKSTWVFELEITSDLLRMQSWSPQTLESINAIRRLGARLGLQGVVSVKAKFTEKDVEAEDNMRRIVSLITLTVVTEIDGQSLTGGN